MRFSRYPKYKETNVEWLGEVPFMWKIKRLKWILAANNSGVWGDDPLGTGDTIVLRSTDQTIDGNWKIDDPAQRHLEKKDRDMTLLVEGDLLVTKSSGSPLHIGKTTLVNERISLMKCCYSNFMQRLRLKVELLPKFIWYFLNGEIARHQLDLLSNSTTGLANLNSGMFAELLVPVPLIQEQIKIVDFLDHETSKIDALIAEQEKLLKLLAEKRQAIISHAVTRGLDSNVPLKDSGVEWIGKVPEHWKTISFRRCVFIGEGQVNPKTKPYSTMMLIAPNHIEIGTGRLLQTETAEDQGAESGKYLCMKGDVIYSKIRPALRKVCLTEIECICSADMYPLCVRSDVFLNLFLKWSILSESFSIAAILKSERVAMPKLNRESLNEIFLTLPSLTEQQRIANYLEKETTKINKLKEKVNQSICLLKERRSALISAAVTGKIDVRNVLPQNLAA